jgi:hypothetical protein
MAEYIDSLTKIIKKTVKDKEDGEYELKFYVKVRDHEVDEVSFEHETFFTPIKRAKGF